MSEILIEKTNLNWKTPDFKDVLFYFEEISKIPRCSKNEEKIATYLENFGKENRLETKRDENNNVLIKVPASPTFKNFPTVILQSHMDIVCEKEAESSHNFEKDSLKLSYIQENGRSYITADKTTLGADDGIGMAYMLAVAVSKNISHPPLELLFTTDEEKGLTGARKMDEAFISGTYLINLDSDEEGVIIIGCAGGIQIDFKKQFKIEENKKTGKTEACSVSAPVYSATVFGLLGGHSGTEIHVGRENANRTLARFLTAVCDKYSDADLKMMQIEGGNAHNAIPRQAECFFSANISILDLKKEAEKQAAQIKADPKFNDSDFQISIREVKTNDPNTSNLTFISTEETKQILRFLTSIQTGVFEMSPKIPDFVLVSGNLATIRTKTEANRFDEKEIKITYSLRSGNEKKLKDQIQRMAELAEGHNFNFETSNTYNPWEPDFDSPFLKKCQETYAQTFQENAKIMSIHAGLECSVFKEKKPAIQMVSIGPDIIGAHTPSEKLNLETAEKTWIYLKELLKSF